MDWCYFKYDQKIITYIMYKQFLAIFEVAPFFTWHKKYALHKKKTNGHQLLKVVLTNSRHWAMQTALVLSHQKNFGGTQGGLRSLEFNVLHTKIKDVYTSLLKW